MSGKQKPILGNGVITTTPASGAPATDVNLAEVAGTTTAVGAGTVNAGTQRVSLGSNDPAVALLTTIDVDTSKIPALGTGVMAGSSPINLSTDDTQFGAIGAAADVDGNIHGQLRSIGEATEALANKPTATSATGSAAIAATTALTVAFEVDHISLHLDAPGTTNEAFTITKDAAAGAEYDTVLFSFDLAPDAVVDLVIPHETLGLSKLVAGDELVFAWNNSQTVTYGLQVVHQVI